MSTKRRFSEKEIAQIFEDATRAQNAADEQSGPLDGLTLEELKQIGSTTGIDPKFIARAAAGLNRRPQLYPVQKHWGIPIGVSRSIELPDSFSDKDWEQLVVDLRKTFKARGKIKQEGSLREWTNGNLHVFVEPTAKGLELRMETQKGNMKGLLYAGAAYIVTSLVMLAAILMGTSSSVGSAFLISGIFLVSGIGMVSTVATTQPRWAQQRERQMEAICKRAVALGKTDDDTGQVESTSKKFLSLEDEEALNQELKQYARQKKASRA